MAFASGTILCPLVPAQADAIGVATFHTDEVRLEKVRSILRGRVSRRRSVVGACA
jgi:hypothetical protein